MGEDKVAGQGEGRHNRIKIKQFNVTANKANAADENEDADRDAWLVASSTSLTPCRARKEGEYGRGSACSAQTRWRPGRRQKQTRTTTTT